jgi:hypothetical protein
MADPSDETLTAEVDHLQDVRPLSEMRGHEVCADVHTALSVAQVVLNSRDRRVASTSQVESSDSLLRELRALGVTDVAPQLVAMVAIVDAAVGRIADTGAMSEADAWAELRKEVLRQHCHAPDIPYDI